MINCLMSRQTLVELYKSVYRRFGGRGFGLGLMNRFHTWAWDKNLKPEEVTVHGLKFHLPKGVDSVAHSLIFDAAYEPEMTAAFQKHIKPGMLLLDVGASFGYYALLGSRLVGPQGRVIAFEPHWENFSLLVKNLEANGCDNVHAVSVAVSGEAGLSSLNVAAQSLVFSYAAARRQPCLTVPLGKFLEGLPKPDAMKMDIEGSEIAALDSMAAALASPALKVLFIECLPPLLREAGFTEADMKSRLNKAGFSVERLDERNLLCLKR